MNVMTFLNFAVRRADREALSLDDIEEIQAFYDGLKINGKKASHIVVNRAIVYADFEYYGAWFNEDIPFPFAQSHPQYQIELIQKELDGEAVRYVYQGDLMESAREISLFPDPERIPWKYGE